MSHALWLLVFAAAVKDSRSLVLVVSHEEVGGAETMLARVAYDIYVMAFAVSLRLYTIPFSASFCGRQNIGLKAVDFTTRRKLGRAADGLWSRKLWPETPMRDMLIQPP